MMKAMKNDLFYREELGFSWTNQKLREDPIASFYMSGSSKREKEELFKRKNNLYPSALVLLSINLLGGYKSTNTATRGVRVLKSIEEPG